MSQDSSIQPSQLDEPTGGQPPPQQPGSTQAGPGQDAYMHGRNAYYGMQQGMPNMGGGGYPQFGAPPQGGSAGFMMGGRMPPSTPKSNARWYVLITLLVLLYAGQTAYNYMDGRKKNERRVVRMQEKANKMKVQAAQAQEEDRRRKLEQEAIKAQVAEQIKAQDRLVHLDSVSQCDAASVRSARLEGSRKPDAMKRSEKVNDSIRDDVSVTSGVSLGASKHLEDAMIASNKDEQGARAPITRICLTGGPCAGKTTALTELSLHLRQVGYRVLLVPEAATILMKGGALIQTPKMTHRDAVDFQINLMRLQMDLEDIFVQVAQSQEEPQPCIILYDRGVMDGQAYTNDIVWQAILDETGWSTVHLRERRYEAVVHLVSAADGAEKFYSSASNEARYETIKEAVDLDRKLIHAWVGHPHFHIIPNGSSFQEKMHHCISTVLNFIGRPSLSAHVHKFLLVTPQGGHDLRMPSEIHREFFQLDETFLLAQNKEFVETNIVRKFGRNDAFVYQNEVRFMLDGERIQKKKQITAREYLEALEQRDPARKQVRKIRQCFIYERQYFMVDTFVTIEGKPSILRIESNGTSGKVIPPFLRVLREITDEEVYQSKLMAHHDYHMPLSDRKAIEEGLKDSVTGKETR